MQAVRVVTNGKKILAGLLPEVPPGLIEYFEAITLRPIAELCIRHSHRQVANAGVRALAAINQLR